MQQLEPLVCFGGLDDDFVAVEGDSRRRILALSMQPDFHLVEAEPEEGDNPLDALQDTGSDGGEKQFRRI